MKRLIAFPFALALAACATTMPSTNGQLKTAYDTVAAYVEVTSISLQRGRITPAQADQASATAKKVRGQVDAARAALAGCKAEPCTGYLDLMKSLQPSLYDLERELRAQQGAK